ncbi:MAG: cupin domain-containing protein [Ginsengibacter sp.]
MKAINPVPGQILIETSEITEATETYNFFNSINKQKIADFNFIRFIVHAGKRSNPDMHASKECWYVASGQGQLTIGHQQVAIKQGELYFFDSHVKHMVENTSPSADLEILSVWW